MALAVAGRSQREGTRTGLWGAAQAVAAGFGGLSGALLVDILRRVRPDVQAFGSVFLFKALLFVVAAFMAAKIMDRLPLQIRVPGE